MKPAVRQALDSSWSDHSLSEWEIEACALKRCKSCGGLGICIYLVCKTKRICPCVYWEVFKRCLRQYQQCAPQEVSGGLRVRSLHFRADFESLAEHHLGHFQHQVFLRDFLSKKIYLNVSLRGGPSRGHIHYVRYRVAEILGRVFCEVKPYPLYPPAHLNARPLSLAMIEVH